MVRKCNRKQRQHCQSNQSNKCISVVFQFFLLFPLLARSLALHFSHFIVNKRKWDSPKCHSMSLPHLSNISIESMNIVLMKSEFIEFRHQLKWPIIHQYSMFHFFVRGRAFVCVMRLYFAFGWERIQLNWSFRLYISFGISLFSVVMHRLEL